MRYVLAAVLVLAAACGGDDGGDESSEGALTLSVDHGELTSGGVPTFLLTVDNGTGEDLILTFASGQNGDVVLSQDGEERWRWSDGLAFTQAIREEPLAAGNQAPYRLEGSPLAVPAGEYDLEATLSSDPAPPPVRTTVTVG